MKNVLLFSLLALTNTLFNGCSKKPFPAVSYPFTIFQEDLAGAKTAASAQDKNIFLMIHADWCEVCNTFKTNVLQSTDIKNTLSNGIITSLIDGDKTYGKPIADTYKVTGFPTFLVLDKNGNVIIRKTGGMNESTFKAWVMPYLK
jgi:thioredoxin-related protein